MWGEIYKPNREGEGMELALSLSSPLTQFSTIAECDLAVWWLTASNEHKRLAITSYGMLDEAMGGAQL